MIKIESLSKACSEFLRVQESCREDIDIHCTGKEFTGEVLYCLTEWTNPSSLTEGCKSALPPKEEKPEKKKLSKDDKKKADARRK